MSARPSAPLKVLVSSLPIESHIRPLASPVSSLLSDGHDVVVACPASFRQRVVVTYRMPHLAAGYDWTTDRELVYALSTLVADGNEAFIAKLLPFLAKVAAPMMQDILTFAHAWKPDVILHDCGELGAYLAAVRLGIPHVSMDNGLVRLIESEHGNYAAILNEHRAALGLDPEPDSPASLSTVASPAPRHFLLDDFSPPHLYCYQHANAQRAGERIPTWLTNIPTDRPLIYVSLGSLVPCAQGLSAMVLRAYELVLAALAEVPCTVVVAVGQDNVGKVGEQPSHIHVMAHAPQTLVLRTAQLFVCHGGFNGLCEAMAAGVPAVVLPICTDQPRNAARCAALGLGLALDPAMTTPEQLHDACMEVLRDERYARNMRAMQRHALALAPFSSRLLGVAESRAGWP